MNPPTEGEGSVGPEGTKVTVVSGFGGVLGGEARGTSEV